MLEELIADKSRQLASHDISIELRHLLKRNLLDSYSGICASLIDRPLIETFRRYAETTADNNGVRVWGTANRVQLVHGIFMNGILGRRSDLVNTYLSPNHLSGNHPSDNISLLLTLGEWKNIDGLLCCKPCILPTCFPVPSPTIIARRQAVSTMTQRQASTPR